MKKKKNKMVKIKEQTSIDLIESIKQGDTKSILNFLREPAAKITAFLTGVLTLGRVDIIKTGSRLLQYAIFGESCKTFGNEIKELIDRNLVKKRLWGNKVRVQNTY
jgi:hypothetical protein